MCALKCNKIIFTFLILTFITTFMEVLLNFFYHTHKHTQHTQRQTYTHSCCLRRRSLALLSASWSARPWVGSSLWPTRATMVESAWASRSRHSSAILWEIEEEWWADRCGGGQRRQRERAIWGREESGNDRWEIKEIRCKNCWILRNLNPLNV